jgi:hypothetical protein
VAAARFGIMKGDLDQVFPRVGEVPFDSERKCMTDTVVRMQLTRCGGAFRNFLQGLVRDGMMEPGKPPRRSASRPLRGRGGAAAPLRLWFGWPPALGKFVRASIDVQGLRQNNLYKSSSGWHVPERSEGRVF